jgi:hypothetical protein
LTDATIFSLRSIGTLPCFCLTRRSIIATRCETLCAISAGSVPKASYDPDEEQIFRDLWEDETQREVVIESLKADYEVKTERPPGL